jgi:asparagine synthase (glutamine-hydrolysing)
MCGISGIFNPSTKKINQIETINKILKLQKSRGPDNTGVWTSSCGKVTFGHNRLSIIDLTNNSNQPFVSIDKRIVITFNGEIYNFLEIREQLLKKKIKFKSNSDTEVIIEAYRYWGLEFVNYFRGMYSFVIWDVLKDELILARDPFGIKPLYYTYQNNIFYFASQIKSILSIQNLRFNNSDAGICSYFMFGNVIDPFTIYKEIKSLEKGNVLVINKDGVKKKINFYSIKNKILNSREASISNENDQINYLKETIDDTVRYHSISDVPITYLLSSGIDSNVLVASASSQQNNINSVTLDFGFTGEKNETQIASKTSKLNNIKHSVKKMSNFDKIEGLNNFFNSMDSPTNDALNNYLISKKIKNLTKVVISGVGADELLFGYSSFERIPKLNNFAKFIPYIKILDNNKLYNFLNKIKIKAKIAALFSHQKNIGDAYYLQRSVFLEKEIENFKDYFSIEKGLEELNLRERLLKDVEGIKDTKLSVMLLEILYYLSPKLLRDSDWATMSNSIEMRTPFVDIVFFEKILSLYKKNPNLNKKDMLKCYQNLLPRELSKRKKTGFEIPYKEFLKNNNLKFYPSIKNWTEYSYNNYKKYEN